MREIKFRAWQNVQLRMREIKGIDYKSNGEIEYVSVYQKNTAPLTQLYGTKDYPLDCLNLMQYTGLKDRNGVRIYAGDVLEIGDYKFTGNKQVNKYVVSNRNSCFVADNVHNGNDDEIGKEIWDTIVFHELYEGVIHIDVLGNIYENPELIK